MHQPRGIKVSSIATEQAEIMKSLVDVNHNFLFTNEKTEALICYISYIFSIVIVKKYGF